jgi:hypothetical protein
MDEAGVPRTRRPLDECPFNEDNANIPNHAAILAREEARLEKKTAADAQKAPDKVDKKAAAAAQKAAADARIEGTRQGKQESSS